MPKKNNADLPKLAPLDVPEDENLVEMLGDAEAEVIPEASVPAKTEAAEIVPDLARPDVRAFFQQFQDIGNNILANYAADRDQIEVVVAHLMTIVVHNQDGKLSKTATENLVKALEVKSNTNTNAIKILDYISKAITAGKGMGVFDGTKEDDLDFDMKDMEDLLQQEDGVEEAKIEEGSIRAKKARPEDSDTDE